MPSFASELEQMNTDIVGAFGRSVTAFCTSGTTRTKYAGQDSSFVTASGTISAVVHEATTSYRSGGGGGGTPIETRVFTIVLADLATICASTGGIPQIGQFGFQITTPEGTSEWWWAHRIEIDGNGIAARIHSGRGAGVNIEAGP